MVLPGVLARMIAWVRKGYPEGVPQHDYLPLFALLARRLTPEEMREVIGDLTQDGRLPGSRPQADEMVREAIEAVTKSPPSEADVGRVLHRLEAAGWDLDVLEAPGQAEVPGS